MNLNLDCVNLIFDELEIKLFFLYSCRYYKESLRYKKEWFPYLWGCNNFPFQVHHNSKKYLGELVSKYVGKNNQYNINITTSKSYCSIAWTKLFFVPSGCSVLTLMYVI